MAPRALVFDLDGTIWDSAPWYSEAIAEESGASVFANEAELRTGGNIVALLRRIGLSRPRFVSAAVALASPSRFFPGMQASLEELHRRRVPMGAFTSLPGTIVEPLGEAMGLRSLITKIVHAGNCRPPKPNPTGIRIVLEALSVSSGSKIFYIGDRSVDAKTAKNAGVQFGWASYGYEDARPEYVTTEIDHPDRLLTL